MDRSGELTDLALEGERVLLRPVREADARSAFPLLFGKREVLDWLVWQGPSSPEELAGTYRVWRAREERGLSLMLAIVERTSLLFRGSLSLRPGASASHELGYWIDPAAWGRGLASDAVGLASWLAFEELGASVLGASVFEGNLASARVLEKNGFQRSSGPARACAEPAGEPAGEHARPPRPQHAYLLERASWLRRPARVRPRSARVERGGPSA